MMGRPEDPPRPDESPRMNPTPPISARVAAWLVLGRVSNLPTIWSDCLAAWVLSRGVFEPTLGLVMVAMSSFYVGGMILNDACDARWDAEHRPGRPIPRGLVGVNAAFGAGLALLVAGLAVMRAEGWLAFAAGLALVVLILLYDVAHKRVTWAPVLMGACRALVYVGVAAAAGSEFPASLLMWGIVLGGYVVGLSFVARGESASRVPPVWFVALLALPPLYRLAGGSGPWPFVLATGFSLWVGFCLFFLFKPGRRDVPRAVTGLIAGVCLVDLLAATSVASVSLWTALIVGCFLLTLELQRFLPGT